MTNINWKKRLLDKLIATQVVSSMTIIEPDSLLFYWKGLMNILFAKGLINKIFRPFLQSLLHDPPISSFIWYTSTVWWRLKYEILCVTFFTFVLFMLPIFKYSLHHSILQHP